MIETVTEFLKLALDDPATGVADIARGLDDLARAYHIVPPGKPTDETVKPPDRSYEEIRRKLESRFPGLGYYGVADPLELLPERSLIGDAIDDLADIIGDLGEVMWRWSATGPDDACWHYRYLYEVHWGRHLHDLRSCLHAIQFERNDIHGPIRS